MRENLNVTLIWVPRHGKIKGNEKADELAREGYAVNDVLNIDSIYTTGCNKEYNFRKMEMERPDHI